MDTDTLVSLFNDQAGRNPDGIALRWKDGSWRQITWGELRDTTLAAAAGLIELGVQPNDRVAILAENDPQWIVTDLAIMSVGAISVALYAPLTSAQVREQLADCQPVIVFVSNFDQFDKLESIRSQIPFVRREIMFSHASGEAGRSNRTTRVIRSVGSLESYGRRFLRSDPDCVQRRIYALTPDDLAAIIYTSGTTGESKGVMLTHGNFVSNVRAMEEVFPLEPDTTVITYLPLNHVYARTVDLYRSIATGCTLVLAESVEKFVDNLQDIRPHYFSSVPRVHEKLAEIARPYFEAGDKDALKKVLGGRVTMCSSGGAALPVSIAEFYEEAGVPLFQGYGLTESSPVISMSCFGQSRIGASGKPIPRIEVKIADDGEILTRGPHVMKGYWNKPEATGQAVDEDGWLHTGDVGRLDEDGFLYITDRKKDIIVTSYGKNVAPQQLENLLLGDPLIDQVCVIGDGRPCLAALIVPNTERLVEWHGGDFDSALSDSKTIEHLLSICEERLRDLSRFEQIRKVALLAEPFSIAKGELTPTLKLRRRQVAANHAAVIEELYSV